MTNLLFNHYENKNIVTHLHSLDLLYKPPSYYILVGHLLNQYYEKIKNKVDIQLSALWFLNFYTNKSSNICKNQLITFLAYTPKGCSIKEGCFYIHFESNNAKIMNAKTQAS